jgi:GTP-binding protein
MRISSAEFALGVAELRQLPKDGIREVAFLGRSNVGKSSLINKLCGRKSLARTSADPGKTRELNYYLINKTFYFVDLPGYGYAKVPEQIRSSWGKTIEQYLKGRSQLALVVQLMDARHDPTELDMMMVGWLDYFEIPFLIALTKADKLPASKMPRYLEAAQRQFSRYSRCLGVIPFSAVTGIGKHEVVQIVAEHLHTNGTAKPRPKTKRA